MATDNGKQDELDQLLDAALAKYATAEPRTGLEERVLANLRSERAQVPDRKWWRWSATAAAAAIAIVVIAFALKSGRPSHPQVANHILTMRTLEQSKPRVGPEVGETGAHAHALGPATRRASHRVPKEGVAAANPKLDQFPSRQQLSEEELALARYVSQFPEEATLIAREQEEHEKEIQQMMKEAHSETESYDSDQQER
jgi:hypothetical protein